MYQKLFSVGLAVLLAAGYTLEAFSQAKPQTLVRQRQAVMLLHGKYFYPLLPMAANKAPYDAAVVVRNVGFLEALSKMPWDNFTPDTAGEKSRAMPEIYKETAKFKEASDKYQAEVVKLATATKGGNEAAIKAAINDVDHACGACHDSFRARSQ